MALAHSCYLLSCAQVLHTLSFNDASFGLLLQLLFPGMPCLCGPPHNRNGKGPSSHCFLLTHFASAQQSMAAWLAIGASSHVPLYRSESHTTFPLPGPPWVSVHLPRPLEQSNSKMSLSTGELYKCLLLFCHCLFTITLEKQ